ncbi:HNH endonuclease [Mycobacterium tuberculosis]|nr:HNH endonuclease [Mycobacterium tuberculosis]
MKVIRALFRPPARRGGCVHPPGRRSRPGRQSRSISSRRAGPLRPAGHGLATPRRRPHRHRTRPQTRHHPEQPAIRRHVTAKWLPDPQARATFEAVLAKLAAPGATNPDDHTPVIDTTPDAAAIDRDTRSQAQRNHDGLLAGLRALIASGKLGQHNGLPVSIVVTTTLTDLQTGAGKGFTGGGTLLPMADVIRMTSHAHHYSPASGRYPQAIFDHGTPLALYHTKRLASPAQRIMLFANDRGCTKPGCDAPAYHSQAHHVTAWTSTGRTDITELTLACGPDNRLAEKGWTTHKNTHGHTEWLPPPHLDHGQPRTNTFHHPERFLHNQDDDDKPD